MKRLLTVIFALLLPLQGVAAALAPMHMALDPAAASMPCHDHAAAPGAMHDASAQNHAPAPDAPRDADAASHLCCHLFASCGPAAAPATPAHKFSDVSRFVLPLATLHIPDSPYRPPRG